MDINCQVVINNLDTFSNAYGVKPNTLRLIEEISNGNGHVESVGVLLRDTVTKKGLVSCQFPLHWDITDEMLWVLIDERDVEAVPICTREVTVAERLRNTWKRLKDKMTEDVYFLMEEGDFKLKVHDSISKHAVIENYIPKDESGYIRRNRKGIFFMKSWCDFSEIEEGKEVSFIPIISRQGLQARAVREVA